MGAPPEDSTEPYEVIALGKKQYNQLSMPG
jgi:hypothetical protein